MGLNGVNAGITVTNFCYSYRRTQSEYLCCTIILHNVATLLGVTSSFYVQILCKTYNFKMETMSKPYANTHTHHFTMQPPNTIVWYSSKVASDPIGNIVILDL